MPTLEQSAAALAAQERSKASAIKPDQRQLQESAAKTHGSAAVRKDAETVAWNWVPVRSMTKRHRPRILQHLLALDAHDRYLRFGQATTDSQIAKYVDTLDFERDEVFGIFNRKLELVAMAHLAYSPAQQVDGQPAMAEFGVSVMPQARGRRFGARLFDNAMLHARNRGFNTLFIHALSENTPMLKIARRAGAEVVRDGSETEAWLKLPPETLTSCLDEVVDQHVSELDYQWKLNARRLYKLLNALTVVNPPYVLKKKSSDK